MVSRLLSLEGEVELVLVVCEDVCDVEVAVFSFAAFDVFVEWLVVLPASVVVMVVVESVLA